MLAAPAVLRAQDLPQVRVGTLQFGTVNWELAVIGDGIDRRHGFTLKPLVLADKDATASPCQSGEVDLIVTDWIWVARQRRRARLHLRAVLATGRRADGRSRQEASRTIQHLQGKRLGVAGGAGRQELGADPGLCPARPASTCQARRHRQFAAPPMLNQLVLRGKLDAVLNFWKFNARLAAKGLVPVVTIGEDPAGARARRPAAAARLGVQRGMGGAEPRISPRGLIDASYRGQGRDEDRRRAVAEARPRWRPRTTACSRP